MHNGHSARLISVKSAAAASAPFMMPTTGSGSEFHGNLQLLEACSVKLRHLLQLVQEGEAAKTDIVPSLLNSARLLEKVFLDRTKGMRPDEQEEDLFSVISAAGAGGAAGAKEVAPVPERVQEWLTATFTRRGSITATGGRRRLRSLATVVQTSVYFEKLFRNRGLGRGMAGVAAAMQQQQQSGAKEEELPPALQKIPSAALAYLEQTAHQWDFDPFNLAEMTNDRPIRNMGLYLFHQFDLVDKFGIQLPVLEAFLDLVEEGYKRHGNPYHNCTHSADVAQTCCFILSRHGLASWLSDIEVLALLFAALIHDFEHTGTTNNYHVQSRSQLAVVYNDKAVLESHHVSAVFRRMHETGAKCNLVKCLSPTEYRQFRSLVIDMVLATDMSTHFAQVTAMKDAIPCPENLPRVDILAYILHAADISHPAKIWPLHERWTGKLTAEFFAQGDREKELGLPCSPLCDRDKTVVASSQVGFIEYIVEPCFHTLLQLLQSVKILLSPRKPASADSPAGLNGDDPASSRPTNPTPDTMSRLRELHDWDVLSILCSNRDRWRDLAEVEKRRIAAIDEVDEEEDKEAEEAEG